MDWMKYRWLYFLISGTLVLVGIFGMINWGLTLGIDFTGGIVAEYRMQDGEERVFRYGNITSEEAEKIRSDFKSQGADEIRFENVGPTVGPELVKKTLSALIIASGLILLWVAIQFKSLKFGISATLATLHDSLILLGSFSILGYFYGAEVDFLFVTAMLTILSFSVHDTIVVYDRIRESQKKQGGSIYELANKAISETMVRSLNNSFTIIFMLVALVLMGGETVKWFSMALLIGTVAGTYSSPFVAVPLLVTWDQLANKRKK
jgi:preprotein translocase subunit SecF